MLGIGRLQRWNDVLLFAPKRQHDARGDHDVQFRSSGEELLDHGSRLDHLLEVVDDQEELLVAKVALQHIEDGAPGHFRDP